jgi:hypothetical protein
MILRNQAAVYDTLHRKGRKAAGCLKTKELTGI